MRLTTLTTAAMLGIAPFAMAEPMETGDFNDLVNQTNMIVGGGCSGTLISLEHRLVLTNHHCIANHYRFVEREFVENGVVEKRTVEERRDVRLTQRKYADYRNVGSISWESRIVGYWRERDLALLQIRADDIPYNRRAVVYNGEGVQRGDVATAVGNPRGLDATMTRGIISSTNRLIKVSWANGGEVPFLQFDGGLFFGNSGGALFNEEGKLIGVPGAISGEGHLGLAITYEAVQEFLERECFAQVYDPHAKECEAEDEEDHTRYQGGSSPFVRTAAPNQAR